MVKVDILIIGAGPVGASLVLALANKGYSTLLLETQAKTARSLFQSGTASLSPAGASSGTKKGTTSSETASLGPGASSGTEKGTTSLDTEVRSGTANSDIKSAAAEDSDSRALALAPASIRILEQLKVWSLLVKNATAIAGIDVSAQAHFATTYLHNPTKSLGFVVPMQALSQALDQRLDPSKIMYVNQLVALNKHHARVMTLQGTETFIQAQLIVVADGTHSPARKLLGLPVSNKRYQHEAVVTTVKLARSHQNHAYERFTLNGPVALLPLGDNKMSLIWTLLSMEAKLLMQLPETVFLSRLQMLFGYRVGRFLRTEGRRLFPLQQAIMPCQIAWPYVFVGNAVHTLHPVAGQGFNLGLRDVASLAQCIIQLGLNKDMLHHYEKMRGPDQRAIVNLTNGLLTLFTSRLPGMFLLRNLGLLAVDTIPFLKKELSFYFQGFGGVTPDLACGISLD